MKTILVLTDFSEKSFNAAEYACHLAIAYNAEVLLFNAFEVPQAIAVEGGVFPPYFDDYTIYEKKSADKLRSMADKLKSKFEVEEAEIPVVSFKNGLGSPGENFRLLQEKKNIWLTIIGDRSSDSFFSQLVFGSDSGQVISKAACPVLIVPEKAFYKGFRELSLACSSFDKDDLNALRFLSELAEPQNSQIVVTHVVAKEAAEADVEAGLEDFNAERSAVIYPRVSYYTIREDDVTRGLQNFVRLAEVELLALVNKKHPFYERLFAENKIKKMIEYHKVPLLIFPVRD